MRTRMKLRKFRPRCGNSLRMEVCYKIRDPRHRLWLAPKIVSGRWLSRSWCSPFYAPFTPHFMPLFCSVGGPLGSSLGPHFLSEHPKFLALQMQKRVKISPVFAPIFRSKCRNEISQGFAPISGENFSASTFPSLE